MAIGHPSDFSERRSSAKSITSKGRTGVPLRRYIKNKSYRKGHLQGVSTISTMSTIQPRGGREYQHSQRAEIVNVSRASKEQVRGIPKDVP
jgi:hypothetical protein